LAKFSETSDAKKGGLFVGDSHAEGGIPAIVTDTGQPIEVEGGEAIINKKATALHWEELSKINQSAGGGVPIPPPDDADKVLEKYSQGGKITNKEKKVVFDKWKKLVNMTFTELSRYFHSKEGKESGLSESEAKEQGISSGRESAEWILKMKKTNWKKWTDDMWKWANKQISFISRMSGIQGDLIDEKGKKTRKYKALLIWGNNPKKKNAVSFKTGGSTDSNSAIKGLKALLSFATEEERTEILEQINSLENPIDKNNEYIDYLVKVGKLDAVELYNLQNYLKSKGLSTLGLIPEQIRIDPEYRQIKQEYELASKKAKQVPIFNYPKNRDRVQEQKDRQIAKEIIDNFIQTSLNKRSFENEITNYEEEEDYYSEDEDEEEDDDDEDMSEVENSISNLTKNYIQEIDTILGVSELEGKRKALLKWIKDPAQKVKVIIAFSGGKDSVAMVLKCIYEFKIPKDQIELWHHEVDGDGENLFDWKCTPSYCQAFADAMGIPILFSYSGGGILREMFRENEYRQPMYFQDVAGGEYIRTEPRQLAKDISTKRKFPAVANDLKTRWCSSVVKIEVMSKAINRLPRFKNQNFVVMTGERRAESKNRAKYHEIEKYKAKKKPSKSSRQALTWRCVIDMSTNEIWDMYRTYKIQPHPCYELGWGRCSCQLCIFGQKDTWASINQISPEKVQKIVDIEKELDHTLYNEFEKIPFNPPKYVKSGVNAGEEKFQSGDKAKNVFESKVVRGKSFIPKEALARWGKEALGEFISPIFVKEWKMPYGANSKEQMGAN
jgi:3'-phosphoadenosine 5'-phosphosulfate sulfotransferase (PAPS reductase)/FAD synthetase